jgi:hypothetical protein
MMRSNALADAQDVRGPREDSGSEKAQQMKF